MISVFLADDHIVLCDALRFLLESQADIRVVGSATNGHEAVRRVQQLQPDVVIMDISMPELNGIEAAKQIHASVPSSQVVILSMHSSVEHIFRAFQSGARGYLLKESAAAEVVDAVRAAYMGRRYLSQRIASTLVDDYLQTRQNTPFDSPLERLSAREREVLQLLVEGKSNGEIAVRLSLSPKSVETYRSRLMSKLGVEDLPSLTRFAIQQGLIALE